MSLKKRCIVSDEGIANQLEHVPSISISIGRIPMMIYYCKGDSLHPKHFVRIDYGKQVSTLNKKGIVVPKEERKRLFDRDCEAHCILGKVKMNLRKVLTKNINDGCVDIYWCKGRTGSHPSHLVRVTHGMIPNSGIGILVFTVETKK